MGGMILGRIADIQAIPGLKFLAALEDEKPTPRFQELLDKRPLVSKPNGM